MKNFPKILSQNTLLPAVLLYGLLLALTVQCTTEETASVDAGEANLQILTAYAAKDIQCGQLHVLTLPVLTDADRGDVELCVFNILAVDCEVWGSAENLPPACLAIAVEI